MPSDQTAMRRSLRAVRGALLNSDERHAARRKRREAKRKANRQARIASCTLDEVASLDNLYDAAMKSKNGVFWKASVQRYHQDLLFNLVKARKNLLAGNDVRRGFHRFYLYERGKRREIASVHFSERVIHKSLTVNALIPALVPAAIRNNTANIKGRGVADAIARLKRDLVLHCRKYGNDGYILLIDFHNYFASIAHEPLKKILATALDDKRLLQLACSFIDSNGDVGLGLGSEPNQMYTVAFASSIDHYVIEMLGIKGYGRYMDDAYAIHQSKSYLHEVLDKIKRKSSEIGLIINCDKTQVIKLSHGFTWLKKKFNIAESGHIVVRPSRSTVTHARRRLKKLKRLCEEGRMTIEQAQRSYQSWRGSILKLDAHTTVLNMDQLYKQLFS